MAEGQGLIGVSMRVGIAGHSLQWHTPSEQALLLSQDPEEPPSQTLSPVCEQM
jgi:hypothetical protein